MLTVPDSTDIQFVPLAGKFYLEAFTDPSGKPSNVLDTDLGYTLKGRLDLPSWLTGDGHVRLVGDEIGGPFDGEVGSVTVPITGATSPHDPGTKSYPWMISVPAGTLPDPSPASSAYHFALTFLFTNPGNSHTDIGAFFDLGSFLVV